jgi:hypothetical protein
LPLQGVGFWGNRTRRDAAGWDVLPFQGEGLTGPPNGRVENIALKRQTLPTKLPPFEKRSRWYDAPGTFEAIELNSGATFKAKLKPDIELPADEYEWQLDSNNKGSGATKDFIFSTTGTTSIKVTIGDASKSSSVEVGPANGTVTVTWDHKKETPNIIFDSSFTLGQFTIDYSVYGNINGNTWTIRVDKVTGKSTTKIAQLGWKSTPSDEAEAKEAVDDMVTLCSRGAVREHGSGSTRYYWHTIAATEAHENVHKLETVVTSNHYWPQVESKLEEQTVKYSDHINDPVVAKNALSAKRDIINQKFRKAVWQDYVVALLADNTPHCRPTYAAQEVLNPIIATIRSVAYANNWTSVDQTTTPCSHNYKVTDNPEYPCYIAFPNVDFSP